jgi:hypothetical protein
MLNIVRDINGVPTYATRFDSISKQSMVLTTGAEQTVTVPSTGFSSHQNLVAVISPEIGANVWVALNATAAVPTGAAASTTSEHNPGAKYVKPGDVLHFISSDSSATVGIVFYATN